MATAIFRRTLLPRATAITFSLSSITSSIHPLPSQTPNNSAVSAAVSAAVSVLTHHRSKSRWSTLHSLFPHGFTPPQISQILLQIRNNAHLALRFFLFTTRNSPSSLHSYAIIIHILVRAHLKSHAKSLIKSAIKKFELMSENSETFSGKRCKLFRVLVETYRECNSAPFVFDLLVRSYSEMNKLDPCIEIVRMLKSREILLNVSTCNVLISTALRIKDCFFGYDLYKEVFAYNVDDSVDCDERVKQGGTSKLVPNVHTFNELMVSFHRNRLLDMVEEVWIEMVKSKCEPDAYSYSILMVSYCEEDDLEKAEKVWEELRNKGLRPDVVGYNTLIGGYCKMGEVEKGEELYREMELDGLEGTCVTYEHLINGYCSAGNADSAMLLYNAMCRKRFMLDSSTVDSLVRVLCCKRSVSEALGFFRSAIENTDFVARESSYALLIKGLCTEGKTEEALKLQAQMAGKGYRPNSDIYSAFADAYMKIGNSGAAEKLRKEMIEAES